MKLDITVRGSAEQRRPAERAIVSIVAAIDGPDRQQVLADALAIHEPIAAQLKELVEIRAVHTWASDQVRVHSHRQWAADGGRGELIHAVRMHVRAEFVDFEQLSSFLDYWSGVEGVEIGEIGWDVTSRNRRLYEAEVRKAAVEDAVAKAQSYADAVRHGRVVVTQLADPGMLINPGGDGEPARFKPAAADLLRGGGPEVVLMPDEIVIEVQVDARFTSA